MMGTSYHSSVLYRHWPWLVQPVLPHDAHRHLLGYLLPPRSAGVELSALQVAPGGPGLLLLLSQFLSSKFDFGFIFHLFAFYWKESRARESEIFHQLIH